MKNSLSLLRKGAAVATVTAVVLSSSAFGQGQLQIGKIAFDKLQSPQVATGDSKSWKPKDWLEFEVGLTLPATNAEEKKSGFVDKILVKWSVALENPDGRGYILLSKDITHINVPIDEEVYSSVYLSPNTVKRVTGSDSVSRGSVDRVMVEVLVNGRSMGAESSKGKPDWANSPSLSDQSRRFPLLNKIETPFKMLWWDRYAEIEEQR